MSVYGKVLKFKRKYPGTIAWNLRSHALVVQSIIDKDEKLLYAFCGQKNDTYKMIFDTCVVALTTKRLIVGQKRLLWGYQIKTITPEMFNDLTICAGLLWGKVEIDTVKENIFVSNLSKASLDEIETNVNKIMLDMKKRKKEEKEKAKED